MKLLKKSVKFFLVFFFIAVLGLSNIAPVFNKIGQEKMVKNFSDNNQLSKNKYKKYVFILGVLAAA